MAKSKRLYAFFVFRHLKYMKRYPLQVIGLPKNYRFFGKRSARSKALSFFLLKNDEQKERSATRRRCMAKSKRLYALFVYGNIKKCRV